MTMLLAKQFILAAAVLAIITSCAAGQQGNPNEETRTPKRLGPDRIAQLLRQPNGLEKAANLVGTFEINGQLHLWSRYDLKTLTSASVAIVVGRIESASSYLAEDGDDIWTHYSVRPLRILKGNVGGGDFTLNVSGGRVTFATGNTAQITTIQWENIQVGQRYLFFLRETEPKDGTYSPINEIEGLYKLSTPDGKVEPFAAQESNPHPTLVEVAGLNEAAFLAKIQSLISIAPSK